MMKVKKFRIFGSTPGDFFETQAPDVKSALIKRALADGISKKVIVDELKRTNYLIKRDKRDKNRYSYGEFDILELKE